jgi:hypothetical protein
MDLRLEFFACLSRELWEVIIVDTFHDSAEELDIVFVSSDIDALLSMEKAGGLGSLTEWDVISVSSSVVLPEVAWSRGKAGSWGLIYDKGSFKIGSDRLKGRYKFLACYATGWLLCWLNNDSGERRRSISSFLGSGSHTFKNLRLFALRGRICGVGPSADSSSQCKRRTMGGSWEVQSTVSSIVLLNSLNHRMLDSSSCSVSLVDKMDSWKIFFKRAESCLNQRLKVGRRDHIGSRVVDEGAVSFFTSD